MNHQQCILRDKIIEVQINKPKKKKKIEEQIQIPKMTEKCKKASKDRDTS